MDTGRFERCQSTPSADKLKLYSDGLVADVPQEGGEEGT